MKIRNMFFITVLVLILSAWSYFYFDQAAIQWVSAHSNPNLLLISKCVQFSLSFFIWGWLTPLMLVVLWWRAGSFSAAFRRKSTQFFLGLLIAMFFCFIAKTSLGRYRPEAFFKNHLYGFSGGFTMEYTRLSMPSDHSALMFSMITSLVYFLRSRWLAFILIVLALCATATRVLYLKHYPSDVGAGLILGMWASYFAAIFCERFRKTR